LQVQSLDKAMEEKICVEGNWFLSSVETQSYYARKRQT
jgi:hypothetical protein